MAERKMNQDNTTQGGAASFGDNWLVPYLLLMLRDWSSYGYDLMKRLAALGFATLNPGTLYRVLRQMEKDGMVTSMWDTSRGGPARRIYAITEAGKTYLNFWASSLEQYQKMMDTFFELYSGPLMRPTPEQPHDAEDAETEGRDS